MNNVKQNSLFYRIPNCCFIHILTSFLPSTLENIRTIFSLSKEIRNFLQEKTQIKLFQTLIVKNTGDNSIELCHKLYNLRKLDFSDNQLITDAGIIHITHLTALRTLIFSECLQLTDEIFPQLPSTVRSLNISGCQLSNLCLQSLRMPLEEVDLSYCEFVTTKTLSILTLMPLLSLKLNSCSNINNFTALPSTLQDLDLSWCNVTDNDLMSLSNIPLKSLKLAGCNLLLGTGFTALPRTILDLDISCCNELRDKSLQSLTMALINLDLSDNPFITEEGIKQFSNFVLRQELKRPANSFCTIKLDDALYSFYQKNKKHSFSLDSFTEERNFVK